MAIGNAPCKGKSFMYCLGVLKLLPLQGDRLPPQTTQGVALGYELLPLQGVLGTGVSPVPHTINEELLPLQGV